MPDTLMDELTAEIDQLTASTHPRLTFTCLRTEEGIVVTSNDGASFRDHPTLPLAWLAAELRAPLADGSHWVVLYEPMAILNTREPRPLVVSALVHPDDEPDDTVDDSAADDHEDAWLQAQDGPPGWEQER